MGAQFTTSVETPTINHRRRAGGQFSRTTMYPNFHTRNFNTPNKDVKEVIYQGIVDGPSAKTAMNQYMSLPAQSVGRFLNSVGVKPHYVYLLLDLFGGLLLAKGVRGLEMDPWDFLKGAGWVALYSKEGPTNLLLGSFIGLQLVGLVLSSSGLMDIYQVHS